MALPRSCSAAAAPGPVSPAAALPTAFLQQLRRKAEERNPDEFYFAMEKARTADGVHVARSTEANKYSQVRAVPCCAVLCCAVSGHVQHGDKIVQPGAMLHWLVGGLLGAVGCWAGTASKHASCWAAFMLH